MLHTISKLFTSFLLVLFPGILFASQPTNIIALINSYSPGYWWSDAQEIGIFKAFQESGLEKAGWKIQKFYLDEKNKFTPEEINASVKDVQQSLDIMQISAALLADDLAAKSFLQYFKKRKIPIGFSGIQGELKEYGYRVGDNGVTGSMERYNFPSVIRLLKKIKPSIDSILFICDENISGRAHTRSFVDQTRSHEDQLQSIGVRKFLTYASNSYEDLINTLVRVDAKKTGVIVASYFSYKDQSGRIVPFSVIDDWINKNARFVDAGLSIYQGKHGRIISIGTSPEEMGYYVSSKLLNGIKAGKDVGGFGIRQFNPLFLTINRQRARQLGLTIPYEVLVYEETTIYQ